MIVGSLKNTARVEGMHPRFKMLFDYVKGLDQNSIELGKVALDGDDVFVSTVEVDGKKPTDSKLEAHIDYIDIHIVLEGAEQIAWAPLEDAGNVLIAYDAEKDLVFYEGEPHDRVNLRPGQFAVVFPEDLHGPAIGDGKIKKMIAKLRD